MKKLLVILSFAFSLISGVAHSKNLETGGEYYPAFVDPSLVIETFVSTVSSMADGTGAIYDPNSIQIAGPGNGRILSPEFAADMDPMRTMFENAENIVAQFIGPWNASLRDYGGQGFDLFLGPGNGRILDHQ